MRRKHYSWSGHGYDRKWDKEATAFLCLVLMVLIGIVCLLAHWMNF